MKIVETLILGREDLIESYKQLAINDIDHTHFNFYRPHHQQEIILFVDDSGDTKILKNRYGHNGIL